MDNIKTLGIDLAKSVFQLHGVDKNGHVVIRKRLSRNKLLPFIANLPKCLIGMEACGSAHYWAREFHNIGHKVKLMAPNFVKPFVKSNKTDRNDAEAICEAVQRPSMRFVPIKGTEQQDILSLHRARSLAIKQRTMLANHIRGILLEYGITVTKGVHNLRKELPALIDCESDRVTECLKSLLNQQFCSLLNYDEQIDIYNKKLESLAETNDTCKRLMAIEGVGLLAATAIYAAVSDASVFKSGRDLAAWLGLVPKQCSSGYSVKLMGISKRGDKYIRTLLVHGGRSVVSHADRKSDARSLWVTQKKERGGFNKAAVAVANKNARIMWALLRTGEEYRKVA